MSFEQAASVFDDAHALYEVDREHGEARELVIGMSSELRMLCVVFIELGDDDTIRIISARAATKQEKKAYEEGD